MIYTFSLGQVISTTTVHATQNIAIMYIRIYRLIVSVLVEEKLGPVVDNMVHYDIMSYWQLCIQVSFENILYLKIFSNNFNAKCKKSTFCIHTFYTPTF